MDIFKVILREGIKHPVRFYFFSLEILLSILTIIAFFGLPPLRSNWREAWQEKASLKLASCHLSTHNSWEVFFGSRLGAIACAQCPGEAFANIRICQINPLDEETLQLGTFFLNTSDSVLAASFAQAQASLNTRRQKHMLIETPN
jgi:hypothetical protein